ncbi:MAG: STAS-like domain-containing protein [Candidatus Nealsonbacteria bacterium]|nr:STAS-like domain-containing protein [Candidatus Nealsonbacteria bacterium]
MRIELKKFGKVLTSRPMGKEAFAAIRPILDPDADTVEIDFTGVLSLSPSWADEFFTALKNMYGNRIKYLPTDNPSVIETLKILEDI